MKIRDSGGLPCPECGSPLVPCKCEREKKRGMISRFGSTLRANPKKRLRSRTLEEKFGDDPLRYGPVFKRVRGYPCFGTIYFLGHRCGPGYAPASAHHVGYDDLDGLLPVCGLLHDQVGEKALKVEKRLRRAGMPSIEAIAKSYVGQALFELKEEGELPPDVKQAAMERGYRAEVQR